MISEDIIKEFPRKDIAWDQIEQNKWYYSIGERAFINVKDIIEIFNTEIETNSIVVKKTILDQRSKNLWLFFKECSYQEVLLPTEALITPTELALQDLEVGDWAKYDNNQSSNFGLFYHKTVDSVIEFIYNKECNEWCYKVFNSLVTTKKYYHKLDFNTQSPVDKNRKDFCFDCMTDELYCHAMTFKCIKCNSIILGA